IAIGDANEAEDLALIRREQFGSILGLVPTLQGRKPAEFGVQRLAIIPLIDGPGTRLEDFRDAVKTLQSLVAESPAVFVHCRAGWGRSPLVVAGYLMQTSGLAPDAALAQIGAKRKISILNVMQELLVEFHAAMR